MAILTTEQRREVWARYMEEASIRFDEFGNFLKSDLLVAVGEIDDWIEAGSKGLLKNCFSEPCRSETTSQHQSDLYNLVLDKRQGEF